MSVFRKKQTAVVEAFKWTGGPDQKEDPEWIVEAIKSGVVFIEKNVYHDSCYMHIKTLEGEMQAAPGDYIIKGIKGELYPCKPDIFELTYEPVND